MRNCLVVWYVFYVPLSSTGGSCQSSLWCTRHWRPKSLNSCPGETNCRKAWHNELTDVFQRNFFIQQWIGMQSLPTESAILPNVHREVINIQQDVWHFQWFSVTFCALRTERKVVCVTPFPTLKTWGVLCQAFLLGAVFFLCFLYCAMSCCQEENNVLFMSQ